MKYFLVILILFSQCCTAQIDVGPSEGLLKRGKLSDLVSCQINNTNPSSTTIEYTATIVYDSIKILAYSAIIPDTVGILMVTDSILFAKGYHERTFLDQYVKNGNRLPEGYYTIFYYIKCKTDSNFFSLNLHYGKPPPS